MTDAIRTSLVAVVVIVVMIGLAGFISVEFPSATSVSSSRTIIASGSSSSTYGPVEVISVTGPTLPYNNSGESVIGMTLKNTGDAPITSLNAILRVNPPLNVAGLSVPLVFVFDVNTSNPLLPGQSIQHDQTLAGAAFQTIQSYPVAINGTLTNGPEFSYTVFVYVQPSTNSASS